MNLAFATPLALALLPLALLPWVPRRRPALTVSTLGPLADVRQGWRSRLHGLGSGLASGALLLLILGLSGPLLLDQRSEVVRQGVDLMLALDVSASMQAGDVPPNRMAAAREAAADFLRRRPHDRIGVVLFSGVPYLLSPPVGNKEPLIARLRSVEPDRLGSGTALGDALAAAADRLRDSPARNRAVVLLTDGTGNRGRVTPLAAARAAATLGIRIYTIGFGTPLGADISLGQTSLHQAIDEEPLRAVAGLTGGEYFYAADRGMLAEVLERIDRLEKSPLETRQRIDRKPLDRILFLSAALLLATELVLCGIWLRRVP